MAVSDARPLTGRRPLARPAAAPALAAQRARGADARSRAVGGDRRPRLCGPETEALLRRIRSPPPASLRHLTFPPGTPGPAAEAQRRLARRPRAAWSPSPTTTAGRPPTGSRTSSRPPPRAPGRDRPGPRPTVDPDEMVVKPRAPRPHASRSSRPRPGRRPATSSTRGRCWRRAGGFDETLPAGRRRGHRPRVARPRARRRLRGAPEMLTYHCVEPAGVRGRVRESLALAAPAVR